MKVPPTCILQIVGPVLNGLIAGLINGFHGRLEPSTHTQRFSAYANSYLNWPTRARMVAGRVTFYQTLTSMNTNPEYQCSLGSRMQNARTTGIEWN